MKAIGALLLIASIITLFIGWVKNILALFALAGASGDHLIEALIRIVGVFIPFLGGIFGWF